MAKIGTLAGYERVSEVPEDDYLMLENQLGFPLYVVAKELVNAYRPYLEPLNLTYTQYIVMMAFCVSRFSSTACTLSTHSSIVKSGT